MRVIKFRGKRKDGVWLYGDLLHLERVFKKVIEILDWSVKDKEVIPETIGQFTGSIDINGIEIYEGDILKTRIEDKCEPNGYIDIYNEVCFKDGSFGITGENTGELIPFSENPINLETVAGNIHDNPELIKHRL